jgi:hypothetical protein
MTDNSKIEEAIETRLLRAVEEDLDADQVKALEHQLSTIRKIASS